MHDDRNHPAAIIPIKVRVKDIRDALLKTQQASFEFAFEGGDSAKKYRVIENFLNAMSDSVDDDEFDLAETFSVLIDDCLRKGNNNE